MAESLLENYNPLYDVHLRQYFALPHMQKHLRRMGLLDSNGVPVAQNGNVESELYARHHAMMDMMLRNRERVLLQLSELQKKYDAAEKVEVYRRVRSGAAHPDEFARNHLSRSLSRPRRAATQPPKSGSGRRRHSSNSFEDTEVINRIEKTYEQPNQLVINPKSTYDRLSANAFKYQFLHKLDDSTLSNYKESLAKQLQKLQRFRDISFGPHSVARHQPSLQASWFFRRRSLKPIKNGTANSEDPHRRQGKSQSPRRHGTQHQPRRRSPQKAISSAPHRLPPISVATKNKTPTATPPHTTTKQVAVVAGVAASVAATAATVGSVLNKSDDTIVEPSTPPPKSTTPEPIEASSPVPVQAQPASPEAPHHDDEQMDTESDAESVGRSKRSVSFDQDPEQQIEHEDHYEEHHGSDAGGATESEVSVPATPPGDHEIHAAMTQSMYQGVPEDFNEKNISLDSLDEQHVDVHEDEEEPLTPHLNEAPFESHDDIKDQQSQVHVNVENASPREKEQLDELYERPYSTEIKHEGYAIQETPDIHEEEDKHAAPDTPQHDEVEDHLDAPEIVDALPEDKEPSPETENPIEDKSVPIVEDASEFRRYSEHSPVIEITEAEPHVGSDDEHEEYHDNVHAVPEVEEHQEVHSTEAIEEHGDHDSVHSDFEEHIESVHNEPIAAAPLDGHVEHDVDDTTVDSDHQNASETESVHAADHVEPAETQESARSVSPKTESVHQEPEAVTQEEPHVEHHETEVETHETDSAVSPRSIVSAHPDDIVSEHRENLVSEHSNHDDTTSVHRDEASEHDEHESIRAVSPVAASVHDEIVSEHGDEHVAPTPDVGAESVHNDDKVEPETESHNEEDIGVIPDNVQLVHDDVNDKPETESHHEEHIEITSEHQNDVESIHDAPISPRSVVSVQHSEHSEQNHHEDVVSKHHDTESIHQSDVPAPDDHHSDADSVIETSPVTEPQHYDDFSTTQNESVHNGSVHSQSEIHSARSNPPSEHDHDDIEDHIEQVLVRSADAVPNVESSHETHTTIVHETSYSTRDGTTESVHHETFETTKNDDGTVDVHHETIDSNNGEPAEVHQENYKIDDSGVVHASPPASEHGSQPSQTPADSHRSASPVVDEHGEHAEFEAQHVSGTVDPMAQSIYITSDDHDEHTSPRSIESFEQHEAAVIAEPHHALPNFLDSPNIQITAPSDAGDLDHVHDNISVASTPVSPAGSKAFPGEPEIHEEHHTETVTTTNGTTTTTTTNYESIVISHENAESDADDEENSNLLGNDHDAKDDDSDVNDGKSSSVHHKTVTGESTTYHFTRSDDEMSETGAGQL